MLGLPDAATLREPFFRSLARRSPVIRIFNHYVSKMAFILLLLELVMLLASASVASAIWVSDGHGHFRTDNLYLSSLTFALVIIFSMSALGMYQHSSRE